MHFKDCCYQRLTAKFILKRGNDIMSFVKHFSITTSAPLTRIDAITTISTWDLHGLVKKGWVSGRASRLIGGNTLCS